MANSLVTELIQAGKVTELSQYQNIRQEVRYGSQNSRIDLLLEHDGLPVCYVEVKSVTLAMSDGLGLFPDAVTSRGTKHLQELTEMVNAGNRAVLFFCVQHTGIDRVSVARDIDPTYADELDKALKAGVEVIAWGAEMSSEAITLTKPVPFCQQVT